MTTTPTTESTVRDFMLNLISEKPRAFEELLTETLKHFAIDRQAVVATMWDLVEDKRVTYDASATFRSGLV